MTVQINAIRVEIQANCIYPFAFLWAITGAHFGARMGLGLVALVLGSLALHEGGHAIAALLLDIPISAVGLCSKGAYLRRHKAPGAVEVAIAAAGPTLNLTVALLLWLLASRTEVVSWTIMVNTVLGLSNFVPLPGSDGRRIIAALRAAAFPSATPAPAVPVR